MKPPNNRKTLILFKSALLGGLLAGAATLAPAQAQWQPPSYRQVEARVDALLSQMTLQEKLEYIHGVAPSPDYPNSTGASIAASSTAHTRLILAAIAAGKAVFCEKPMAETLEDANRAIAAAKSAGRPLQVGFNRRFARGFREAHDVIAAGGIGTPQLLRSLTRDPGLANPAAVPPWTIFTQTLIHDFDALNWLNPGAEAVEVYATADALVAPEFKGVGLLDTAVVVVKFDNGAIATAEANFSSVYGYDVRAEVFGSAGMVSAGNTVLTAMAHHTAAGRTQRMVRSDVELFGDAYAAEFASFVEAVRTGQAPEVTGVDARRALAIALACIESYQARGPVPLKQPEA